MSAKDVRFSTDARDRIVVKGIEPRDQIEAMVAAQMAAVHNATMTFARRLGAYLRNCGFCWRRGGESDCAWG
jgi:hypothetical protein